MENQTPIRKKAFHTRQKLLDTAIHEIAAHGYHNVTVDQIAHAAGLSTGSAYRYFKNKKEMLIAALEYSFAHIQEYSHTEDSKLLEFDSIEAMLSYALEQFDLLHRKYYAIHEELESLRHIDADIKAVYDVILERAIDTLIHKCPTELSTLPHLKERLYVGLQILENYAHMQMDASLHDKLQMDIAKQLSIQAAVSLITQ